MYESDKIESIVFTDGCKNTNNEVNFIEQVEFEVTIEAIIRGDLEIFITAPSGTRSLLLPVKRIYFNNNFG